MSDTAKVRLVRCPKCQNLLPELADYSVYQCGGCGAVLRGIFLPLSSCHLGFVFTFDFDVLPNFFNEMKTFLLDKIVVEICSSIFYFIATISYFQSVFVCVLLAAEYNDRICCGGKEIGNGLSFLVSNFSCV